MLLAVIQAYNAQIVKSSTTCRNKGHKKLIIRKSEVKSLRHWPLKFATIKDFSQFIIKLRILCLL